ncbi:Oidioi.mRNA.OKI2018_I69.PAR.g10802.t3.cds [Oikopleura dioica]|uniref:Oidioi.mRNA.OKI2018_I69.PAR.g10802.t3.cds n=1 Tax=Oikopleura dioica TaxID=34765 RepID=A0ABN7RWR7_OIKDI|nr:Oidioi.mRNA.OKI2018_I69.PAR.g10802.t3.cds [Oikopleura dioica]
MSDTRSQGSSRSRNKARLPLPSQLSNTGEVDLLSQFSGNSDPKSKKSSKRSKNLPLPSGQGDAAGDLLSSLLGGSSETRSNNSKSSRRKKLPLPSNGAESSLLNDFLEPSSSTSTTSNQNRSGNRLAPSFAREKSHLSSGSHTVEGESGAQDLLERLTNLSSRSNESGSKRSINTNGSRRNLPKPSQMGKTDDLLSMFSSTQPQEHDYDSENIVYEPADDDEAENEDYFDEGNPPMSPRDTLKEASDVLSILSGHGGGIKPSVLTGRVKYSDDDSKSMSSAGSRERPESQISGKGYISDKSSMVSASNQKSSGLAASLTSSGHEGRQWNQNRAYFLRTAKLREAKKNSPLGKWLPGGSMSSSTRSKNYSNRDEEEEEETLESAPEADQAFVEHLQLELEEARRIIRSHEQKILALQDEVEAARESCMEEECERVEAEIEKEKVHNENRLLKERNESVSQKIDRITDLFQNFDATLCDFETYDRLKVQIQNLERTKSNSRIPPLKENTRSMSNLDRPQSSTIAIQTDELRTVKSMGDVLTSNALVRTSSLSDIENADPKQLTNEISEAGGLVISSVATGKEIAIPFENKPTSFKVAILGYWMKALILRESDFSGSLYKHL